ncbi:unnamed protein product [Brachionus calyciflorus]|uniref:Uncharacterized protein n=1 Tax=Brachionus calyciflorus TaxID=104777 RepID=A0A814GSA2_9BILA|nr:unnamed protein product [Brachionus calyciflorus]
MRMFKISFYYVRKKHNLHLTFQEVNSKKLENPFIKSKKSIFSDLSENTLKEIKDQLFDQYAFDYSFSDSLKCFEELKNKSDCTFAKNSKLWGSPLWNAKLTVKENVQHLILPSFLIFTNVCDELKLDGFLVQLPGNDYGHDLEIFSKIFFEILTNLSDFDPKKSKCMREKIESSNWVFEFNKLTFFITTFLPIYPENHSRYSFGINECFILFQPEISFAHHNLPHDTPVTNWSHPKTIRDKIRINFKNSNREYLIRDTVSYPMCHDIIKPIEKNGRIINWWKNY